jgi:hypothetical protein
MVTMPALRLRHRLATVAVAVTVTVAAGCASAPPARDVEEATPEITTQLQELVRVVGTVTAGPESGCLLLDTGVTRYQLVGDAAAALVPGREMTVTGLTDPNTPGCGESTPLTVSEAVPAD